MADWTPIAYTSLYSDASGRYMPFETLWTSTGGSNYVYAVDSGNWVGQGVYTSTLGANRPIGGVGRAYLMYNIYGSFIQSPPLEGGVGTIYYTAKPRRPNQTQKILVQVSTNGVPSANEWETVKILDFPYQNPQLNIAEPVVLNRLDVRCVRFFFAEESPYETASTRVDGAVTFDHIVFSTPWTWIPNTGLWGPDFIEPRMFVLQPIN